MLDTAHIHVMVVPILLLELEIGNLHLLYLAVPARMGVLELHPHETSGGENVAEQCAWYVEVFV